MKVCGTVAYCAPEIFFGVIGFDTKEIFKYTDKCDIYSAGIIMWEFMARIMTGAYQRPYAEFPQLKFDFQIVTQVSEKKLRPSVPAEAPSDLVDLIHLAWNADPQLRPSVDVVREKLLAIKGIYLKNNQSWDQLVRITKTPSQLL